MRVRDADAPSKAAREKQAARGCASATKCFSIRKLENSFPLSCLDEIFHRDSCAAAREMQIAFIPVTFILNVIHIFH